MSSQKTALILGATGLIGSELVKCLSDDTRYSRVTCILRHSSSNQASMPSNVHTVYASMAQPDPFGDMASYFAVDHVYVCLGTTMKKAKTKHAFYWVDYELVHQAARLADSSNVDSFVWVSSVGANRNSQNFYLRIKGQLEHDIDQIKSLKAVHLNPSLLLGKRNEYRLAELVGEALGRFICPFLFGSLQKYKPIEASKVARQMIDAQYFGH